MGGVQEVKKKEWKVGVLKMQEAVNMGELTQQCKIFTMKLKG